MPDDLKEARERMCDEELGRELAPQESPAFHLWLGATLPEPKRAALEHLVNVGRELQLWEAGVGPKPVGVIVCASKQIRGVR